MYINHIDDVEIFIKSRDCLEFEEKLKRLKKPKKTDIIFIKVFLCNVQREFFEGHDKYLRSIRKNDLQQKQKFEKLSIDFPDFFDLFKIKHNSKLIDDFDFPIKKIEDIYKIYEKEWNKNF